MAERRTVGELAIIVADLLRRDNVTSEAEDWLQLALADIYSHVTGASNMRQTMFELDDTDVRQLITQIPQTFISPVEFIITSKEATPNGYVYAPEYLSPHDFVSKIPAGSTVGTGATKYYTIQHTGTVAHGTVTGTAESKAMREVELYIYPGLLSTDGPWMGRLVYLATPWWLSSPTSKYLECFPWWEYVVIWKAAALGARALRLPTAEVFETEAEQALKVFNSLETYAPDRIAYPRDRQFRSVSEERFRVNLPETIG